MFDLTHIIAALVPVAILASAVLAWAAPSMRRASDERQELKTNQELILAELRRVNARLAEAESDIKAILRNGKST